MRDWTTRCSRSRGLRAQLQATVLVQNGRVTGVRVSGVVVAAIFAATLMAPAAGSAAAAELTAAQIVEQNVAARGGLDAWRKVRTMIWTGHIESAHAPVPNMSFVLEQQRPNKTRFEIDAMSQRTLRVFDGTQGWKLRPAQNGRPSVQPYTAQELKFAQRGQGIDGPLIDAAAKGNSVLLEGVDEVEGHEAYRLTVRSASGESDRVWVDAKTFLEVRYDRPSYDPSGAHGTVSVFYRDYKAVEGLQIPSVIETGVGSGKPPDRMLIEKIALNASLADWNFANPGAPRQRDTTRLNPGAASWAHAPNEPSTSHSAASQSAASSPQ
jgi:outer membrane lipoprotein-sorting protein